MSRIDRFDRFQQRHPSIAIPLAVIYKTFEDRALYLAALITYYAFVSLFPILLLFLSAAGYFLDNAPHLKQQLIDSALANLPGLGSQIRDQLNGFHGNGLALAVGIVGTGYGTLGAMNAAQTAFNQIFGVPRYLQPDPIRSRVRSAGLLVLLGTAVVVSTGIATLISTANSLTSHFGPGIRAGGYLLTLAINIALFSAAFQLLTALDLKLRNVAIGGVLAGGVFQVLQTFGSRYVAHQASHGSALYGSFGVVLAALAWIYLESVALVVAAEVNAVVFHHLWPRGFLVTFRPRMPITEADRRSYEMHAANSRFRPDQSPAPRGLRGDDERRDPDGGGADETVAG